MIAGAILCPDGRVDWWTGDGDPLVVAGTSLKLNSPARLGGNLSLNSTARLGGKLFSQVKFARSSRQELFSS